MARRWIAKRRFNDKLYQFHKAIADIPKVSADDGNAAHGTMINSKDLQKLVFQSKKRRYLHAQFEDVQDQNETKKYQGQWTLQNGKMVKDGIGRLVWKDGSVFEGQFENDKMSGIGQIRQVNGDIY